MIVDGYSYSPIDSLYFITTGPLLHLPGVSCDNFSGENRNNDQFFLSHCHTGRILTFFCTYVDSHVKSTWYIENKISTMTWAWYNSWIICIGWLSSVRFKYKQGYKSCDLL